MHFDVLTLLALLGLAITIVGGARVIRGTLERHAARNRTSYVETHQAMRVREVPESLDMAKSLRRLRTHGKWIELAVEPRGPRTRKPLNSPEWEVTVVERGRREFGVTART